MESREVINKGEKTIKELYNIDLTEHTVEHIPLAKGVECLKYILQSGQKIIHVFLFSDYKNKPIHENSEKLNVDTDHNGHIEEEIEEMEQENETINELHKLYVLVSNKSIQAKFNPRQGKIQFSYTPLTKTIVELSAN